jgi:hypothetical protein
VWAQRTRFKVMRTGSEYANHLSNYRGANAGFIARWISPSPNNPQGFVLTTVLQHFSAAQSIYIALIKVPASLHPLSVLSSYCGVGIKWQETAEHGTG